MPAQICIHQMVRDETGSVRRHTRTRQRAHGKLGSRGD